MKIATGRVGEVSRFAFNGSVSISLSPVAIACEGVGQTLEIYPGGNTEAGAGRANWIINYMSWLNNGREKWGPATLGLRKQDAQEQEITKSSRTKRAM